MIRFSVCGAASYALGELLRLMVNHPETQVAHLADSFAAGRNPGRAPRPGGLL